METAWFGCGGKGRTLWHWSCSNTLFVGKETSSNLTSEGQLLSIAREKKLRLLLLFIRT